MTDTPAAPKAGFLNLPRWLVSVLSAVVMLLLPLILVLITARLIMTPLFFRFEYNRPGLPPDPYGFTTEDRLYYGTRGLLYLFNNEDISYLGELTLPGGRPAFNERELSHMEDVKVVTRNVTRIGLTLLAIYILCVGLLAASTASRSVLWQALFQGSILTVGLIVALLLTMLFSFRWLFTQFHRLLQFQGDSWLFPTSDTLIRLYPEELWVHTFAIAFGMVSLGAILIGLITWRQRRRERVTPV